MPSSVVGTRSRRARGALRTVSRLLSLVFDRRAIVAPEAHQYEPMKVLLLLMRMRIMRTRIIVMTK
jgi:hypothetical protein